MKIPRHLELNGNWWRVRFTNKPGGYPKKDVWGCCSPDTRVIDIATGLTVLQRWTTYVHEVFHALEFEYGEKLPSLRRLLVHKLIYRIEEPIARMILDSFAKKRHRK